MTDLPLDTIICGDNAVVMGTFPDACVDLTVTSPPYDNLRTYGGHSWDFEAVAQQLWRVTKPGGVVVWVVADATVNGSETGTSFRQALRFMEIGFRLHDTMIYQKSSNPRVGPGQDRRYQQAFEFMFVLSKGPPSVANMLRRKCIQAGVRKLRTCRDNHKDEGKTQIIGTNDDTIFDNVWWIPAFGRKDDVNGDHPATFPESLARDHILSWSSEGDVVLDPFLGSGTVAKMARAMGRRYVGIEINPDYVEICRKRLAQQVLPFSP